MTAEMFAVMPTLCPRSHFDVLIVEDDPLDAVLVSEAISRTDQNWDFTVAVAHTLSQALEHLSRCRPDVIMLDLHLPDAIRLDGLARLQRAAPDVPVVVMTGSGDLRLAEKAVCAGAQDFLRKGDATRPSVPRMLAYAVHRNAAAEALRAADHRFRSLIDGINDVVALHGADGQLRYASPSAARLLGIPTTEGVDNATFRERIHPEDRVAVEQAFRDWQRGLGNVVQFRLSRGDNDWIDCESVGSNLLDDPAVGGIVVTTRDITDRKRADAKLAYQAVHDGLTGLPNRTLFFDRLDHALARRPRAARDVAVLFVDVDHFKVVNDSHGHKAGDDLLIAVAARLVDAVRPGDTVARLGGDEFAVLCEDLVGHASARAAAERVAEAVSGQPAVGGRHVHLSVSIGVAVATTPEADADTLLRNADAALYRAKHQGRGRVEMFDDELRAAAERRAHLEQSLGAAVENGEMTVHYQPQVELRTGLPVGAEALLRWQHPVLGSVSPSEFIGIAEETGLIDSLGRWVLEQACRELALWRAQLPELALEMAVNISGRQLADPHLTEHIADIMRRTGVEPGRLCLEITESVVMDDAAASVATLRALRGLGIRLAIDDFGTGYSSLAYLKRFPVDRLKVDRAFVSGLGRDPEDSVIVAGIAQLASSLGLDVVAEGVETPGQLAEVAAVGCQFGQGFLWSMPVTAQEVRRIFAGSRGCPLESAPPPGARAPTNPPVDDVVSVLTHELRTPITVIRGFAETLAELLLSGRTEVLQAAIEAINRQTHGMESMLTSLADMRGVDEGTLSLHREPADLAAVTEEIVSELSTVVPSHSVEFECLGTTEVSLDRTRFGQILANLVTNAARWSPPGTPIVVRVENDETGGRVQVVDLGPGIPADRVGEIFRKFSRLDRSRKGTGLGLYLARAFARAHGGDLRYRRATTGGAEFTVILPSAHAPALGTPTVRITDQPEACTAGLVPGLDQETVAALQVAMRAVVRAELPEQVVGAAIGLAHALGGWTGTGVCRQATETLPFDLSFGIGAPVVVGAPDMSVSRLRLEAALPQFAEDAGCALARASSRSNRGAAPSVDRLTGFLRRGAVVGAIAGRRIPMVLAAPGAASSVDDATRTLARLLRGPIRPGDVLGRIGRRVLVLARPDGDLDELEAMVEQARATWPERGLGVPVTLVIGTSAEDGDPLGRLERRLRRLNYEDRSLPMGSAPVELNR